jgi:glycosyltransferase involved in cell wall biosynthesis
VRLAIVTARFWPLVGAPENQLLLLAEQLRLAGHEVSVATAAWDSAWPSRVLVREVAVHRIPGAPHGSFRTLRFLFNLGRWFREHKADFDLVLVAGLRYEAYIALGTASAWGVPVILQVDAGGPAGDLAWLRTAPFGQRVLRRCRRATRVVATSPAAEAELLAAGFTPSQVTSIAPGVPLPAPGNPNRRIAARKALADVNFDLRAAAENPVIVASGRLDSASGIESLLRAFAAAAARFPAARLWIAGDGPERQRLWSLIGDLDLRARAFLPGTFSPREEFLQAADLFIAPATAEGPTPELAQAMAVGLPCIATDLPAHRDWIESETTGLLVRPSSTAQLEEAICRLLANPAEGVRLGAAARRHISERHGSLAGWAGPNNTNGCLTPGSGKAVRR